jgi:hypothetical protein
MPLRALLILAAGCSTLDIPPEANIADGDTDVAPVAVFRIPLDPATLASAVSDDAVTLTNDDGFELPVTAELDDSTMTLELTPIRPMDVGTTYTLESSTLIDIDGESIALSFSTLENRFFRQVNFLPGTVNPTDYIEEDEEGRSLRFVDPGPDLVWPSEDDILGSYTVTEERVGDTRLSVSFAAGPDGEFFTPDDTPTSYRRAIFEGPLAVRNDSFGVGPDGAVGTADDTIIQLRENSFNEARQLTRIAIALDGGDGVPGSEDDNVIFVLAFIYDERGLVERTTQVQPGPDGELGSADDVIPDGPPTNIYDERGVYLGSRSETDRSTAFVDNRGIFYREDFFDAGRDGVIGTADDRINLRIEHRVP